jgi:hypothetical protein
MKTAIKIGTFLRTYFAIGASISLLAISQTQVQTEALLKFRTRYKWVLLMLLFAANAAAGLYIAFRRPGSKAIWERLELPKAGRIAGALAGVVILPLAVALFLYARADYFGSGGEAFFRLFWLFWWIALVQAAGLRLATGLDWARAFILVLLLDGTAAQLFTLGTAVSDYPFSMGWSEASRYYYGSLVFSRALYGESLPLSVMHGSRYLLQSFPFLLGQVTPWAARLWQVLLWGGLTLWASWALVQRLGLQRRIDAALVAGWLFLYFFQGAVYYHLQVCTIIILLGVSLRHRWSTLAAIVVASVWAGMSRVNWLPVPAMLGITLYVLEKSFRESQRPWDYIRLPMLWGAIGLVAAFAGQALYIWISGNTNLEAFASSFTSALLWYRWLPSPTNPIGIVPAVLIVSLPVAALILWRLRAAPGLLHPLRLSALSAMLLILLVGGLVVSTKIGGGGDLHNMDAYLVLLAILGAYCLSGEVHSEGRPQQAKPNAPWSTLVLMAVVPVAFSILRLANPFTYQTARAAADLATLRQEVADYAKSGEILFMYERHLLTFGMIPEVHMVPDYEVVTLMEMAISGNEAYLGAYYRDLEQHRFAAIVAHPQNLGVETGDFIEENDAWNRLVAQPLLCQYKPVLTLDYSNVQILIPRARPCPEFPPAVGMP